MSAMMKVQRHMELLQYLMLAEMPDTYYQCSPPEYPVAGTVGCHTQHKHAFNILYNAIPELQPLTSIFIQFV